MKSIKKGGLSRRLSIGIAGAKGGLGILQSKAESLMVPKDKKEEHQQQALSREAHKFVAHLGELKGAYVKIGQMLALYGEHILPAVVTDALHTLESSTKPLDWSAVVPQLTDSLGDDFSGLKIDNEPVAAASLAQVHLAEHPNYETPLCIKIQYPGIADAIEDDFRNVMQMLSLARWIKSGRQMESLTKELKQYLLKEVDYRYELDTARRVKEKLNGDTRYWVPSYHEQLCSDKVLTMEYVEGFSVTSDQVQALSQARRNALAEAMLELFFKEAFEWRLMQTDPNFGNYRIAIGEQADRLVLLDFGAVHDLDEVFCSELQKTIVAAQNKQKDQVIEGLLNLNCLRVDDSQLVKESFSDFCIFILEPFWKPSKKCPSLRFLVASINGRTHAY